MRPTFCCTGRRHQRSRRAAAAVEFALTLTILLMFVMACFEFSRVSMLRHTADNAAYEGARNAIVPGATPQDAIAAANDLLTRAGVRLARVTVTPETIDETTTSIRVQVDVPVPENSWVVPRFVNAATVGSSVQLMTERTPLVQVLGLPQPSGTTAPAESTSTTSDPAPTTSEPPPML